MPSRTYNAHGLGFQSWIDLNGDNKGPVILVPTDNAAPHAYAETHEEAERVFGVTKGGAGDNLPGSDQHRSFSQSFAPDVLEGIKVRSRQFYKDKFDAAYADAETTRTEGGVDEPAKVPARAKARR